MRDMACRASLLVLVCLGVVAARAAWADTSAGSCTEAADVAERQLGLPSGLLRSIGAVETGNRAWSVDADGLGQNFASAGDAIAFVRRGIFARYVDVGCFQVDLAFHPDAFRSLDDAFDPLSNATAAGRYLLSLRRGTSSWFDAVARYHSGQQDRGRAYATRVYASLDGISSGTPQGAHEALTAGIRVIVPAAYEGNVVADRPARIDGMVVQTP